MFSSFKLGLAPKRADAKHLYLANYLVEHQLPEVPEEWNGYLRGSGAPRMYLNDELGCCTISGLANHARIVAAMDGRPAPEFADQEIRDYYMRLSGGIDSGLVLSDVLDFAADRVTLIIRCGSPHTEAYSP